ncbi:N-acetylmuramoyl-L-alanine amidase [Sneathiella sp. CAU 1612]|uniref:N-acetylmuramoyl-L-alanine amidase n=1 Tax=Sneathiella sedimenti TaxID=2816034 RepID=A0ABS3F3D1_9PROT|nr:N-acetylmuramoyl-L-alanine amidase [Sneathiella sedimenti]MBO0333022.1 N-acetylmuramoyl-L-alanine amidase [Sneathiella sedimenti]
MSKAIRNIIWRPSPNFDDRAAGTPIDMLVLHYTGMKTAEAAIERLTDETAKVSAHYLVQEDGQVLALVAEEKRAWHAGVSRWRGADNINARSVGIEIVNPGHEFGYRPFPDVQMEAVTVLATDIVARHAIPAWNVVGHSDVAPNRKEDPGELFEWRELARKGVGLWYRENRHASLHYASLLPGTGGESVIAIQEALNEIGYDVMKNGIYDDALTAVICAFQRHWRPSRVDGNVDAETQAVLYALRDEVRRLT